MRATLPATLLLSVLLAACASKDDSLNKHVVIDSSLKVHPGLIRQTAPAEPKADVRPATEPSTVAKPE